MPIQGHAITDAGNVMLRLPNGRGFSAKRLHSVQTIQLVGKPGETRSFPCVTYYFFVGHDRICNDYLERTLVDMKDRLLRGMDQRWAYVSASMWYGKLPWIDKDVTEAEADATLRKFVTDLAEKQLDWDQIQR